MQAIEEFLTTWAAAEQAGDTTTLETQLASDFTAAGPLAAAITAIPSPKRSARASSWSATPTAGSSPPST